ncbi:hypothetical protein KP509_08G049400 [Ceratopteris richardii]|uniref:MaoC-like domain-containing protein n=1 Tax=Ceratopteris richardii TaxID=49495 RepID=A0A8T2UDU9_CERRI|nr:hypothetical protein KP509_08G049400 [Ceratopteris richardii]
MGLLFVENWRIPGFFFDGVPLLCLRVMVPRLLFGERPSHPIGSDKQAEGEVLKKEHIFAQEELSAYSILSGDSNPIHTVPSAAAAHGFSACVVHGMLCATLFSSLISSRFDPLPNRLEAIAKVLRTRVAKDSLSVDLKLECYKKETGGLVLESSNHQSSKLLKEL